MRKWIGILALIASQAPVAVAMAQAPQTVSIELSSFKFTPSQLTFQHGHAYHLHLVNAASGGHDFTAPEFFAASTIAPADRGKVAGGKIRLSGRQTVDIVITPDKVGSYPLTCSHFLHSTMGMKGAITVQ